MAVNTFDSHLAEVGDRWQEFTKVASSLQEMLNRHNANDYGSLVAGDYAGRQVTKAQYDAAITSITNLVVGYMVTDGNATNINEYLYEVP